jgi:hypothetical protein
MERGEFHRNLPGAEALKSLGAKTIDCIVADTDDKDACLWQGGELFHRQEGTVLDRAEVVLNCLRRIRAKAGQTPTLLRRRQPHDKGYSAAEKLLGVSRRDLRRLEKIAGMCPAAKKAARQAKLDDILNALLDIAEQPTKKQVARVLKLKQQYAGGRRKPSAAAKSKTRSPTAAATDKKRAEVADDSDEATDEERSSTDSNEEVKGGAEDAEAAESPPPGDDGGIPSFLRRTDEENIKAKLQKIYETHLAPEWPSIPLVLQCWFVTKLLGIQILNIGKENRPQ